MNMSLQDFKSLMSLVEGGDVESVRTFLSSHKVNLNQVENTNELTPLMLASKCGHLEIIELLIEKGAPVNFITIYPARSALMLAVEGKKVDAVKLLLCHGAEATRTKGECALTIACKQGDVEMVKTLLPGGPTTVDLSNVVASLDGFGTFKKYGEERYGINIVNIVDSVNYSSSSSPMSPVNIAVKNGHTDLLKWLLKGGAKVPASALCLAIVKRNGPIPSADYVKLLLKHGAAVNEDRKGLSALMMASYYGDVEIVEMLLKKGADVDYQDEYSALWIAAMEGHVEVVKLLLKHDANVNLLKGDRKISILQGVMECFKMPEGLMADIMKLLMDGGANVIPEKEYDPNALLTIAINNRYVEVVKLLLEKAELPINRQSRDGEYLLMKVVRSSHNNSTEIAHLLMEAGARTDVQDYNGKSLLMHVRKKAQAKLLLDKGVPVNKQDNVGGSALLYAMERSAFEVVELLLENGADLDLAGDNGITARSILRSNRHKKVYIIQGQL